MEITQDAAHPQMLLGGDGRCVAMCTSMESAKSILQVFNAHASLLEYFLAHEAWSMVCGQAGATVADESKAEERAIAASTAAHKAMNQQVQLFRSNSDPEKVRQLGAL